MSALPKTKSAFAIAALAVVGLFAVVGKHSLPSPIGLLETRALAQAPDDNKIRVAAIISSGANDAEAEWNHFQVTMPPHSPMLDMHVGLLVDNAGSEYVREQTTALPQSFPLKFKLDTDDDSRVKAILKAQGFTTKDNLVTYNFTASYPDGENSFYRTVTFDSAQGAGNATMSVNTSLAAIGTKMVLMDEVVGSQGMHSIHGTGLGRIKRIASLDALPPNEVHRFTVYVMFTPHQGPLRDEGRTETITRE